MSTVKHPAFGEVRCDNEAMSMGVPKILGCLSGAYAYLGIGTSVDNHSLQQAYVAAGGVGVVSLVTVGIETPSPLPSPSPGLRAAVESNLAPLS